LDHKLREKNGMRGSIFVRLMRHKNHWWIEALGKGCGGSDCEKPETLNSIKKDRLSELENFLEL